MKKIKDIKLRVPEEYLQPIKDHAKSKGMSMNQLVISLLEKDMGIDIVTVREQNKQNNHASKIKDFNGIKESFKYNLEDEEKFNNIIN